MSERFKKLLSVLVILVAVGGSLQAADKDRITAVFVSWEPFGYLENDRVAGFELEIFEAVMNRLGIEVTFSERPWKRCLYMIRHGAADALISALKTPEREIYAFYPDEHISINMSALFTLTDNPIEFDGSLTSLRGKTIGVTSGFSYGETFDQADFLVKDGNTRTGNIIDKIMIGRYELGIGNIAVIGTLARKRGVRHRIRFLQPLIHSQKLYAIFSKAAGHGHLCHEFSRELRLFKSTPAHEHILKKYGISSMP